MLTPAARNRSGLALNILILCTGNSARSIMAEALFNHYGRPGIRAYSAGSTPTGAVNGYALEQIARLKEAGPPPVSKSWQQFAGNSGLALDFVITVCDRAATEPCPAFPGNPSTIHWGLPDPAAASGTPEQIRRVFAHCFEELQQRVVAFTDATAGELDRTRAESILRALADAAPESRAH